jgi:ribosomal protein L40E
LIEVLDDEHLKKKLFSNSGFLVNVDYPTKDVKLHRIHCRHCNPENPVAVKPSSKRQNKTGEFWYSDNRQEANSKATEIATKRGYKYAVCAHCNP